MTWQITRHRKARAVLTEPITVADLTQVLGELGKEYGLSRPLTVTNSDVRVGRVLVIEVDDSESTDEGI